MRVFPKLLYHLTTYEPGRCLVDERAEIPNLDSPVMPTADHFSPVN
jgi:hypothetical protein